MAPRLVTGGLAFAGALLVAFGATLAASDSTAAIAALGPPAWEAVAALSLLALVLLTLALMIATPRPMLPVLALLGIGWLVSVPAAGLWRWLTPIVGGSLLAIAELAYWSIDLRIPSATDPCVYRRRGVAISLLVVAGSAVAAIPQLHVSAAPVAGLELTAIGLAGATAMLALAALLAWRLR